MSGLKHLKTNIGLGELCPYRVVHIHKDFSLYENAGSTEKQNRGKLMKSHSCATLTLLHLGVGP